MISTLPRLYLDRVCGASPGIEIRARHYPLGELHPTRLLIILPNGYTDLDAITRGAYPCLVRYPDDSIDGPTIASVLTYAERNELRQMVAALQPAPVEVA